MYRRLSEKEIKTLELQGCSAGNWNNVEVTGPFLAERLKNVQFEGKVRLGSNTGQVEIRETIVKPSGITNCDIRNCTIGNNVFSQILAFFRVILSATMCRLRMSVPL